MTNPNYQPFEAIKHLQETGVSDPLKYYNYPLVGGVFRKRITMGLDLIRNEKFERLVEIGYGSGFLMPYWTGVAREVYGLDLDAEPGEVSKCLGKILNHSFHLEKGSILEMPYEDDFFDGLVAFSVLEHIANKEKAAQEVARVVKPGGKILIGMPAVNKAMEYAFKAIGFKNIHHHHVTTPKDFFQTAQKKLKLKKRATLPLNLYQIFLFEK
jgi:SAM-dependent methyltransferase